MSEAQGLLEVFEPPYRSRFHATIVDCGCCGKRSCVGYDATHNGHNCCGRRNSRGLGCECTPMQLTLNHITYQVRLMAGDLSDQFCWCNGDTHTVNGSGRKHRQTPEHLADQLVGYYLPRVFTVWPVDRHAKLRLYIDAMASDHGVLDLLRGAA